MATSNLGREIIRVGEVSSTMPDKGKVRVKFPDMDCLISYEVWVVNRKTKEDRDYWMPDIGDQVLCAFLGNGLEAGFVLGAIYSDKDKPPVCCQDKRHVAFSDGTCLEYDRKEHVLSGIIEGDLNLTVKGNITMVAGGNITINGKRIDLN